MDHTKEKTSASGRTTLLSGAMLMAHGRSRSDDSGFDRRARNRTVLLAAVMFLVLLTTGFLGLRWAGGFTKEQVRHEVRSLLGSTAEGLRSWLETQRRTVATIARNESFKKEAETLFAEQELGANFCADIRQDGLRKYLKPWIDGGSFIGYGVTDLNGKILAAFRPRFCGATILLDRRVIGDVERRKSSVWQPSYLVINGQQTDLAAMMVTTPLIVKGEVKGALFLLMDPGKTFSKIISAARPGQTGETYAFDGRGVMLSESRFTSEIQRIGLLRPDQKSTVLNLELRQPGVNLMAGEKPSVARDSLPFIAPVEGARNPPRDIVSLAYPDYRGVEVIGAWKWLPEYGFGIVTKVDREEAFGMERRLLIVLCLLYGLIAAVMIAWLVRNHQSFRTEHQREKAEQAVQRLGSYTLEKKLGEGGMGVVYTAKHTMLRRPAAIKLLRRELIDEGADWERMMIRFSREVQSTCELSHPNTISIYDFGRTPKGDFYYVMEFLGGMDLEHLVRKYGPLSAGRTVYLVRQACGSLAEAHRRGMIHRDIKPANLFVCERGGLSDFVKVLDFGLVKQKVETDRAVGLTAVNAITGTPAFIAPEAVENSDNATFSVDIYALGVTLYYLLTGKLVFERSSMFEMCIAHMTLDPPPLSSHAGVSVPADLEKVVMSCLAKEPSKRPASASVLDAMLAACACASEWSSEKAFAWWSAHDGDRNSIAPSEVESAMTIEAEISRLPG